MTDEHRPNEDVALIDQPSVERVCCEGRPADGEVASTDAFMSRTESRYFYGARIAYQFYSDGD